MTKDSGDRLERVHKKGFLNKLVNSRVPVDFKVSDYNSMSAKGQLNGLPIREQTPDIETERSETPSPRVYHVEAENRGPASKKQGR